MLTKIHPFWPQKFAFYVHEYSATLQKNKTVSREQKREKILDFQQNNVIFTPWCIQSWPLCSTQHKAMQQMFEKLTCTNSYQINDGTIIIFTFFIRHFNRLHVINEAVHLFNYDYLNQILFPTNLIFFTFSK